LHTPIAYAQNKKQHRFYSIQKHNVKENKC
jgi:hypothetical protein